MGVEMISPPHPRRRNKMPDGRKLRRYKRRWKVERLFAWIFRSRRLVTRYEEKAENFLGFVQLACAQILWRQFARCVLVVQPRAPSSASGVLHLDPREPYWFTRRRTPSLSQISISICSRALSLRSRFSSSSSEGVSRFSPPPPLRRSTGSGPRRAHEQPVIGLSLALTSFDSLPLELHTPSGSSQPSRARARFY